MDSWVIVTSILKFVEARKHNMSIFRGIEANSSRLDARREIRQLCPPLGIVTN